MFSKVISLSSFISRIFFTNFLEASVYTTLLHYFVGKIFTQNQDLVLNMIAKFHRIIHSIPDFIVHFYSKKKKKRKQIFTTLETLVKYNKILSIIILIPRIISIIFNEVRSKNFLSSTEPSSIFNGGKFNSGRRDRERERSKKDESLARSKKNSRWGKGIEKKKKK